MYVILLKSSVSLLISISFGRTCSNETFYADYNEGFHSKCQSAANLLQKRRQLRPLLGTGMYGAVVKTKILNRFCVPF